MKLTFAIPGIPKAKARARSTKSGFHYTPKDTVNYEVYVKECFLKEYPEHIPITGPVELSVKCYFPRPKSHYGTGKNANRLKDNAPEWHTKKPDFDNVFKSIKDGLNKIAWKDDSQVCYLTDSVKVYTDEMPQVIVEIITERFIGE